MAYADKRRYQEEIKTYVAPPNPYKHSRRKKHPLAPKKSRSAYSFFMSNIRADVVLENKEADFKTVGYLDTLLLRLIILSARDGRAYRKPREKSM
jgi:hypothetical protein